MATHVAPQDQLADVAGQAGGGDGPAPTLPAGTGTDDGSATNMDDDAQSYESARNDEDENALKDGLDLFKDRTLFINDTQAFGLGNVAAIDILKAVDSAFKVEKGPVHKNYVKLIFNRYP